MSAQLELIIGCMFAGKTSEFISRYHKYKRLGKNILVINHCFDERYGKGVVSSHNKEQIKCYSIRFLDEIQTDTKYLDADIVMIDEAQFFEHLVEFVQNGMDVDKKHFIVCGLSGDSSRKPFGQILDLIPLCTDVVFLKAMCKLCNDNDGIYVDATYSMRLCDSNEKICVGTDDSYIPTCHKHYIENTTIYFEDKISTDEDTEEKGSIKKIKSSGSIGDINSEWMLWGC